MKIKFDPRRLRYWQVALEKPSDNSTNRLIGSGKEAAARKPSRAPWASEGNALPAAASADPGEPVPRQER